MDCEELYRALIRVHNRVEFELSKRNWKKPVPVPWRYVHSLIEEGLGLIQEIESRCTDIPYYVASEKDWLLWRKEVVEEAIRENLVKAGYSPSSVYYDGYQFARVNITGLKLTDLYYIAVMVKYWAQRRRT